MRPQPWICVSLPAETKLTCGREAEVFLFPTGGVVELEDVEDGLRILLLLRLADVGGLKETGPLLRHALDTDKEQVSSAAAGRVIRSDPRSPCVGSDHRMCSMYVGPRPHV